MNKFSEALDRHITGNYGEDQFKKFCQKCDRMFFDDEGEEENDFCENCRKEKK